MQIHSITVNKIGLLDVSEVNRMWMQEHSTPSGGLVFCMFSLCL